MFRVSNEDLIALQSQTDKIRNISIIAHVDHGKKFTITNKQTRV